MGGAIILLSLVVEFGWIDFPVESVQWAPVWEWSLRTGIPIFTIGLFPKLVVYLIFIIGFSLIVFAAYIASNGIDLAVVNKGNWAAGIFLMLVSLGVFCLAK